MLWHCLVTRPACVAMWANWAKAGNTLAQMKWDVKVSYQLLMTEKYELKSQVPLWGMKILKIRIW